jgi:hypothetical protein
MNLTRTDVLVILCFAVVFVDVLASPVIPIAVKNTMIMRAHAQTQTQKQTNANATTSYLTYKDSKGRFTIDYPSNGWNVTAAKNRFEDFVVSFRNLDTLSSHSIK